MTNSSHQRNGAKNLASIQPDILAALEAGTIETANLTEGLGIRMDRLMAAVVPKVPANAIDMTTGIVARMTQAGASLRTYITTEDLSVLQTHPSDTVRGWVAFAYGQNQAVPPLQRLHDIQPFAADKHFGVREWAWMAVRAIIVADPLTAISVLAPWTQSNDPNLRRFASEATRPRGVWAASIPLLRKEPHLGLSILSSLRNDEHRYVEDSVANWMNDAAKDNPDWVVAQLREWKNEGVSKRLITRASRSINKI